MIEKCFLLFPLLVSLFGCYAGTVKPLLSHPDFKAENEPIRTLRIHLITDNTYKKDKIEKFVSKCSNLIEIQVGIRLEIVDWYQIQWENELNDISKMEIRIAAETWSKREQFDIAVAFVYFVRRVDGTKLQVGAIDTYFWRYILIKELDPFVFLHELFHAFLSEKGHSEEWAMRAVRHSYGSEWYWLTPEERKEVLQNKWRNFNLSPTREDKDRITR